MFCVQKFTFDTLPIFTEDMIIKHSLMKSVLWGNSFFGDLCKFKDKFGKSILKSVLRDGSFLGASCTVLKCSALAPTRSPQVSQDACFLSMWRMQVPRSLPIPVVLFPFWLSHKHVILWVGAKCFSGWPLSWLSHEGSWEHVLGALLFFWHPELTGLHTGLLARGCRKGSVSRTQSSDMFGLARGLRGVLPTFFKSANFSKKFRVEISEGWHSLTQTAIIRVVLT